MRSRPGEKQMLSFLCYNAFANQTCIFIDEPEISLHVDWQRILFPNPPQAIHGQSIHRCDPFPVYLFTNTRTRNVVLAKERGDENADAPNDREGDSRLPRKNQPADITG